MNRLKGNPKIITDSQLESLHSNMEALGDLSGILHDEETDNIYGGNQRPKKWNLKEVEIQIVETFEVPTKTGTIALGYIIDPTTKEKFNYRKVRWTEEQRQRALITANELGGSTDWGKVKIDFEIPIIEKWGVDVPDWVTFNPNEDVEYEKEEPKEVNKRVITFEYTASDYKKVKEAIKSKGDNMELVLWKLLKL